MNQYSEIIATEWTSQTSSTPDEWTPDKPERGQCVPTALVVQDLLGGDIKRVRMTGLHIDESHYYNVVNGEIIDWTDAQYDTMLVSMAPAPVDAHAEGYMSMRDRLVTNPDTNARYELLRTRVFEQLHLLALYTLRCYYW